MKFLVRQEASMYVPCVFSIWLKHFYFKVGLPPDNQLTVFASFKDLYLCMCVWGGVCWCLRRTEEGNTFFGAGVTGHCGPLYMNTGNQNGFSVRATSS